MHVSPCLRARECQQCGHTSANFGKLLEFLSCVACHLLGCYGSKASTFIRCRAEMETWCPYPSVGHSPYCPWLMSLCSSPINGRQRAAWLPREAEPHGDQELSALLVLDWGRGTERIHLGVVQLRSVFAHWASDCLGTGCMGVIGAPTPE